jgi:hypothetical protein
VSLSPYSMLYITRECELIHHRYSSTSAEAQRVPVCRHNELNVVSVTVHDLIKLVELCDWLLTPTRSCALRSSQQYNPSKGFAQRS